MWLPFTSEGWVATMFLSKRSNGIYYLWFFADGGKKQKISTGCKLKSDALKFLKDFNQQEIKRKTVITRKTLSTFFSEYIEYSRGVHTLKTQQSISNAFRELIRIVGDIRLDAVGVMHIEGFLATKKAEASEWTARKYYIHLASAFETALRWEYLGSNPFRKIQKPKMREIQPAYFTKEEFQTLMVFIADEQYRNICKVGLYTGMRLGEILNLQWADVDFGGKVVHVRNTAQFTTKTRRNRSLPISDHLFELLNSLKETAASELIFHDKGKRLVVNNISRMFKPFITGAGLRKELHFHSLRHTFASWLVQDGVSLYEIQRLLGHSNIAVTEVYSHLEPEKLHSTVNKISLQLN
jgi:integrase